MKIRTDDGDLVRRLQELAAEIVESLTTDQRKLVSLPRLVAPPSIQDLRRFYRGPAAIQRTAAATPIPRK